MTSPGIASAKQLRLPLAPPEDEARPGLRREDPPVCLPNLLERALERSNMLRALVLDRLIQQALAQVLQAEWDRFFSPFSFGFRPRRSAHQAIACAQQFLREGYDWVVDLDLERFFDRVVHEVLMSRVKRRIAEPAVLKLIDRYLKSGVMIGVMLEPTEEGVPQGGPLSPLLANLLLDDLDRELEKRGHRFVRYADDVNIYVRSRRAGERVLESVKGFSGEAPEAESEHGKARSVALGTGCCSASRS